MPPFLEPVYYKLDDSDFPLESIERLGCFVWISDNIGHALTFNILTNDTNKVIYRSRIHKALNPKEHNLHVDPVDRDPPSPMNTEQRCRICGHKMNHHFSTCVDPIISICSAETGHDCFKQHF